MKLVYALIAGAVFAGIGGFTVTRYGAAQHKAGQLQERIVQERRFAAFARDLESKAAAQQLADAKRETASATAWGQRMAAIKPVVVTSTEKVLQYAQTPAGRVACLDSDRVQSILADRNALFAPLAAGIGIDTLPADTDQPSP